MSLLDRAKVLALSVAISLAIAGAVACGAGVLGAW